MRHSRAVRNIALTLGLSCPHYFIVPLAAALLPAGRFALKLNLKLHLKLKYEPGHTLF